MNMFRQERNRPFAANDCKSISDDFEMLYPGLLGFQLEDFIDGEQPSFHRKPLRKLVNGLTWEREDLFDDQYSRGSTSASSSSFSSTDNELGPPPLSRKSTSRQQHRQAHVYTPPSPRRTCEQPQALSNAAPKLPLYTSFYEGPSEIEQPQPSRSSSHRTAPENQRHSRHSDKPRSRNHWVTMNMNPQSTGYCEEDMELQQQEELIQDLDDWLGGSSPLEEMLKTWSFNG